MTARDRVVVLVIAAAVALLGAWFLVVAPERKNEVAAAANVEHARAELAEAQQQAADSRQVALKYKSAVRSDGAMKRSVPTEASVPALIDEVETASERKAVQFASIASTGEAGAGSGGAAADKSTEVDGMKGATFSFIFAGGFFAVEKLMAHLTALTHSTADSRLAVGGRLLVIDGVHMAPEASSKGSTSKLTGTVQITAFTQGSGTASTPATGASSTPSASTTAASTTSSGS